MEPFQFELLIWLARIFRVTGIGSSLMKRIETLLGKPLDAFEKEFDQAVEYSRSVFHERYGDRYGASGSTFIDHNGNQKKLKRSTYPGGKPLTPIDLNREGFDGSPRVPQDAVKYFLETFCDAIQQTSSRALDRDLTLQKVSLEVSEIRGGIHRTEAHVQLMDAKVEGFDRKLNDALNKSDLPKRIRAAVTKSHLREISRLLEMGQTKDALAYSKERIQEIDDALEEDAGQENRYVEEFRSYRQQLLFSAALAASRQGDVEAGRTHWRRARGLGSIDSELQKKASITLFNVGLKDELRHFMEEEMDQESEAYLGTATPCLAYLEKDWLKVDEMLTDARSADRILMRVEARIQSIDATDIEAVKLTAELLDQTDGETILPIINLARATLTLKLLKRVVREYTPLDYDRSPLIDRFTSRIKVALETTEPDSMLKAHALSCLSMAAGLLRDDKLKEELSIGIEALPMNIRSSVFFSHDPELSPEKIDVYFAKGHVTTTQAAFLKAERYQASEQTDKVVDELYTALYASQDERERVGVLRLLIQHLRQANRIDEIRRLIESISLRPADRWLLRAENFPTVNTTLDFVDEIKAFPLDVDVIEHVAKSTLSTVDFTSPEKATPDEVDLKPAEEAVRWASSLVKILPSRSSRLHFAWALYAARHYDKLLKISRDLDPFYAEEAAELEAWALIGLGRRDEAIDCFISASREFPQSIRFVIHAARFLLIENRPAEAVALLKPRVDDGSQDPDILLFYAQSIRNQAPNSQNHASRAFDLLATAYDLRPDPIVAQCAWQAARAAQKEAEGRRFFHLMMAEAPVKVVETRDDFSQALRSIEKHKIIQIDGGIEYLAEMVREERRRTESLEIFLRAHALAYVDFFQHFGRSWELWAHWTQQFEKRSSSAKSAVGVFSVLADWPSVGTWYGYQYETKGFKLFLDQSAILTLGVLGPKTSEQILSALKTSYVHPGILDELLRDLTRIEGHLRDGNAIPCVNAAHFLRQRSDTIVTYSDEIGSAAPDDPKLGPRRLDLGVAVLNNALYVTDLDNSEDWPEEIIRLKISSSVLLASLNEAGEVSSAKAKEVAESHPHIFAGWDSVTPQPIPGILVFDEYAIVDWVSAGLGNVLGNRAKVGPWTWRCISVESEQHEAMELAYERLKDMRSVFQSALDNGFLVEIEANGDGGDLKDVNEHPEKGVPDIEKLWSGALKSLRTAQSHGLHLWADDRFFTLLLKRGGPKNLGLAIEKIRTPFVEWAEAKPPISTMELLNQLSSEANLTPIVAQDAASRLFSHGYRMAHPLLLAHALRQYPMPESGQLTPPFRKLVQAITEIPHYLTEPFNEIYGNREGYIRLASTGVATRLIVGVWEEAESLAEDQRSSLANAFLGAFEQVFHGVQPTEAGSKSGQLPMSFWQSVAYSLQMMPVENESSLESCFAALQWVGRAAASRSEQRKEILWVLEDNVLDSLKYALKAFDNCVDENSLRQIISTFVVRAFIPLTNASFDGIVDPLLRRTVSTLARFTGGGRVTKNYYQTADKDDTPLKISEEENENAAAELLAIIASGDLKYLQSIWGTDLVFGYTRSVPGEWKNEGSPPDKKISVKVRCSLFSLLWDGHPSLYENIVRLLVYNLAGIDPALAYQILLVEDDLLSDDTEKVQVARDRLGIELLRSAYFDLQRDLVHAMHRLRHYETDAFTQFLGRIGERAAQELTNHPMARNVWQIEGLLVPVKHFLGRALLTDRHDDGYLVLERIEQLSNAGDDEDNQTVDISPLAEWLEDKASVAEHADDPFVAAWALRTVLLALTKVDQGTELNVNGRRVKLSDWAANYIEIALAPNASSPSKIGQRMIDRRRLTSAALLLASFVCSGPRHLETYSREQDPRAIWLEHVWLMTTKLQVALVGQRGGVENATKTAAKAVQELELDTSDAAKIDYFDPFAFGAGGDDIGIALTLTAMLKVIRQLSDDNECPTWWTDRIRSLVEELTNVASDKSVSDDKELGNRLELTTPFCVRTIAEQLHTSLAS